MEGAYRLRIACGEKQFEAEGDKNFVLDMWKKFQDRIFLGESVTPEIKGGKNLSAQVSVISPVVKSLSVGGVH